MKKNTWTAWGLYFAFGLVFFTLGYFVGTNEPDEPDSPIGKSVCEHTATTLKCIQYLGNYDGDTIKVKVPGLPPLFGENVSVRIVGIDTAEIKGTHPCEKEKAREAQALVARLLSSADKIELQNIARDKYFRILADVVADGESVSSVLLHKKLAYPYDGGRKRSWDWCTSSAH